MDPKLPLWAVDIGQLIVFVVVIVFMLVRVLGGVLSQQVGKGGPEGPRVPPGQGFPRPRGAPPPPGGGPQPPAQDPLAEVQDFLRRALERQLNPQQPPPAAPPPPPRYESTSTGGAPTKRASPKTGKPPRKQRRARMPSDEHVLEAQLAQESVAEHVAEHLDTHEFADRARQLSKVEKTERQIGEHVSQVFSHQVGTLATASNETGGATESPPQRPILSPSSSDLAAALHDPARLRQALVMQEVLRRPEERW